MNVDLLSLPMGANPDKDMVVGFDELGGEVRRTAFGTEYTIVPTAVEGGSRIKAAGRAIADDPMGSIGGAVKALASGAWNAFSMPGRAASGEMPTYGDMVDTAGLVSLGGLGSSVPKGALAANSFKAYHGSPHDFDKFSVDKIGTGEGAQAYGHGLYFAEAEDVAESYKQMGRPKNLWTSEEPDGWRVKYQTAGGHTVTKRGFQTEQDALSAAKGNMYEVEINADPDTFLDWDRPLNEQPQARAIIDDALRPILGDEGLPSFWGKAPKDGEAYTRAERALPQGQLPKMMAERGVPGIKYKDAGSRGAGGTGTSNFVVFDDSLISILRKYGLAPGMFGAGLYGAQQSSNDELQAYLGGT